MKRFIVSFVLIIAILSLSTSVFAAPDTVAPDYAGDAVGIVTVTNPQGSSDMSFDNSYVVSGYGEVGALVTLYGYNPATGLYEKLYKTVTTVTEAGTYETAQQSISFTIGESTLFVSSVNLNSGTNSFMLYAEKDGKVQVTKFFIIKHNYNIIDIIRSWGLY